MLTKHSLLTLLVAAALALPAIAAAQAPADDGQHEFGEIVDYQMLFPVADGAEYTYYWDTFWAARYNGIHHAQDIMAPKMTPVVAPVAGTIGMVNWSRSQDDYPNPDRCCTLTIDHDDGWSTWYIHLNNDTPGTDDGQGWGIAEGIKPGVRVYPGQVIGWVGDSGNAENTGPHLHFELIDPDGTIVNPIAALDAATWVDLGLTCDGETVTIFGTSRDDVIEGTEGDDVIHGRHGDDVIHGNGGNDVICAGVGDDRVVGGSGADRLHGNAGNDTISGGPGDDLLSGGTGRDRLRGRSGADRIRGNGGNDVLIGGGHRDRLAGGPGNDRFQPGWGKDRASGGAGRDRFFTAPGSNRLLGGDGRDTADYSFAPGAAVDLGQGTGTGLGSDWLDGIENIVGSELADLLTGDGRANLIEGGPGDDVLDGAGGDDVLMGGEGEDELIGGGGEDTCDGEVLADCEGGTS